MSTHPDYIHTVTVHLSEIWRSICALCIGKTAVGIVLATLGFLLGADNNSVLLALLVLTAVDFITAISAAKYNGTPIESRRALKSATKVVVYGLFITAGHQTSQIVGTDWIEAAVISFLALTELVSIMENIGKMGFMVPMTLLNRVKELRDNK